MSGQQRYHKGNLTHFKPRLLTTQGADGSPLGQRSERRVTDLPPQPAPGRTGPGAPSRPPGANPHLILEPVAAVAQLALA